MSITVKLEYLAAAVLATANFDVRFYLQGVAIGNGIVAGTNGHLAVIIEDETLKDVPQMIIPKEAIQWLLKKLNSEMKGICNDVTIEKFDDVRFLMKYRSARIEAYEIFIPIDGKFPDVMRVMKIPEVSAAASPLVDFSYMKIIAKAKQVLTGSRTESISMKYTSQNEQIYFPLGNEKWHGIIMPMRSE